MAKRNLFIMIIVLLLVVTPLVSADWKFNNVISDLIKGDEISEYGKFEINDWFGFKNLMSLELKQNSEQCEDTGCSANKTIIMYEDGILIDEVRFMDLKTGKAVNIKNYEIYTNGNLYDIGEEVPGDSNGIEYNTQLRGNLFAFQEVDWQIKSAGKDWITEWATWSSSLMNGTVAYWKFDETIGANAEDIVNGYDLFSNSSNWTTGLINNGLAFNGTSRQVAYNESVMNFNATDITWSFWFKLDEWFNASAGGDTMLFERYDGADNSIQVFLDNGNGDIIATVEGEGLGGKNINDGGSKANYSAGQWVHVAFVWDGTNDNISIHVNGTTINSTYYAGTLNTTTLTQPFAWGYGLNNPKYDINYTIDEASIHNRTLSIAEIQDIFNNGVGKTYGGLLLNSPEDNYNSTKVNSNITFNCTYNAGALDVHNVSLYHNATGTWTLNQTNSTVITGNSTTTFDVIFNVVQEGITWNCYGCNSDDDCEYGTNRTLNIKSLEINSEIYNTTTWETDVEDFIVNVSGNGTTLTANLWYNGTSYVGTKAGDDSEAEFTRTLDIPIGPGNKSFHWEILQGGFSTENTSAVNQTINSTIVSLCNATINVSYVNYTFKDEENGTAINGSIDVTYWGFYLGSGAYNKTLTFSNVTENPSYAFCVNPDVGHKTLHQGTIVQYYGAAYPQRRWTSTIDLTNATLNQTLYLLGSADGIYSVYQTQTSGGVPITGVTVQVERQFAGIWTLVEQGTTDGAGAVTFWLNPDYDHRFTFTKTNYASVQKVVRPSSSTYTVVMAGSAEEDVAYNETKSLQGIKYSYSPQSGRLSKDTTYTFTFNVTASLSNLLNYSIQLRNVSGSILNRTSDTTSTGGNLSITLNTSIADKIWGRYYVDVGAGMVVLDSDAYWLTNITDYTPSRGTLWHFFYYSRDLTEFGGEENRAEFSRVVAFFLILTILLSALCFMTGWDFSSPGGMLTLIMGAVWLGSFSGFLTMSGITIWPTVDKYALAFVVSLVWFGYSLNTVRRQTG